MSKVLVQANEDQLARIKKELNEDAQKLKHNVNLFYDWLKCEDHLPKDVGTKFVENYIRLCKNDLQTSKEKFEKFIISTEKYKEFYNHGHLDPIFFSPYKFHRLITTLPCLTPEGFRILTLHIDDTDITHFNIEALGRYCYLLRNYFIHNDISSGVICIFDLTEFGLNFLPKMNLLTFQKLFEVTLKLVPTRLKSVHIVNLPGYAEVFVTLVTNLLAEKLRKRMVFHKSMDGLLDYFDRDLLPKEFGGTLKSLNDIGDDWMEVFMQSDEWLKETEKLKLLTPVPKNKQNGSNDCDMGGSFRKLCID